LKAALQRPPPTRPKLKRILIALEDEKSARYYFESWKVKLRSHLIDIELAPHEGSAPKSVIEAAKAIKKSEDPEDPFDEVWVVFDTEGPQNPDRLTAAKAAIDQAQRLGFKTAVSNPSWELWLLLHFEYYTGNLLNGRAAKKRLTNNGLPDYDKGGNCFDQIVGRTETAILHAKRLFSERYTPQGKSHPCDCHPCTEVYRLVESLLSNR
jgi:hypothetical protein